MERGNRHYHWAVSQRAAHEQAADAYEVAEAEYLRLLRARASHESLGQAARAVAGAAGHWYAADLARELALPESQRPAREYYDVTEVLNELWVDIAAAYNAR